MTVSTTSYSVRPIYCDFETKGKIQQGILPPSIVQIGAYDPTRNVRYSAFLRPEDFYAVTCAKDDKADPEVESKKRTFKEVWPEWDAWMRDGKDINCRIVLIFHNAWGWDQDRLKDELHRIGKAVPADIVIWDSLAFAKHLNKKFGMNLNLFESGGKKYALQALAGRFNIPYKGAHKAVPDADTLYQVCESIFGDIDRKKIYLAMLTPNAPVRSVGDLFTVNPFKDMRSAEAIAAGEKTDEVGIKTLFKPPVANSAEETAEKVKTVDIPVFWDTETTGLHDEARIVDFAAFTPVEPDEKEAWFESLVNPEEPIPQEAIDIHHITDEMVKEAPVCKEMLKRFSTWLGEKALNLAKRTNSAVEVRFVFVAHNSEFDQGRLSSECDRARFWLPYTIKHFCSCRFANSAFAKMEINKKSKYPGFHKLETLAQYFGIPGTQEHRAKGDVDLLFKVVETILGDPAKVSRKKVFREILTAEKPAPTVAALILDKSHLIRPITPELQAVFKKRLEDIEARKKGIAPPSKPAAEKKGPDLTLTAARVSVNGEQNAKADKDVAMADASKTPDKRKPESAAEKHADEEEPPPRVLKRLRAHRTPLVQTAGPVRKSYIVDSDTE